MKPTVFEMPGSVPAFEGNIPVYRIQNPYFSEKEPEKTFWKRLAELAAIFRMKTKSRDLGERLSIQSGPKNLDLYKTSDSFWYANRRIACPEEVAENDLPDLLTARKSVLTLLNQNQLLLPQMRLKDPGSTYAISSEKCNGAAEAKATEVKIQFGFSLDNRPVFGPGAKVSVGLAGGGELSQLTYFWRNVEPVGERPVVSPQLALRLLTKDFRFRHLRPGEAKVRLHSIELGHYAPPPFVLQRHLIPVWRVKGTAVTEHLPRYDFTLHVTAVRLAAADIKREALHSPVETLLIF